MRETVTTNQKTNIKLAEDFRVKVKEFEIKLLN